MLASEVSSDTFVRAITLPKLRAITLPKRPSEAVWMRDGSDFGIRALELHKQVTMS